MCCPSHESMVQSLRGQEDRRVRVQDSYLLATKAREVSEARSKGRHHSVIGKPSLRVGLLMGLLGLSLLLLLAACDDQDSGAGQEHKKSTSGGTAPTDVLIVFVRYLDLELTKSAIFTMYPNGSHIHQITHPPEGWSDGYPAWSPMGRRSPSIVGAAPRIVRGAGFWSSTSTPALRARSHTAYPMRDVPRRPRLHHPLLIAWQTPNPTSQPTVSQ